MLRIRRPSPPRTVGSDHRLFERPPDILTDADALGDLTPRPHSGAVGRSPVRTAALQRVAVHGSGSNPYQSKPCTK